MFHVKHSCALLRDCDVSRETSISCIMVKTGTIVEFLSHTTKYCLVKLHFGVK